MGIRTAKIVQQFTCDNCKLMFEYNQPTSPAEKLPVEITDRLKKLVAVSDPSAGAQGYETVYCDDDCAVSAIRAGKHRRAVQLVVGAKPGDVEQAAATDTVAKRLKKSVN